MATNDKSKIDLDGFEVEMEPDESATDSVNIGKPHLRGSFRTPVGHGDRIGLRMQSESFKILDISETGLQALLQRADQFQAGQTIDSVEISFSDTSLKVKGKVVHVSQIDLDQFAIGLELEFPNPTICEEFKKHHAERLRSLINRQTESKGHKE